MTVEEALKEILKKAFTVEVEDMWHMHEQIKVVEVKDIENILSKVK